MGSARFGGKREADRGVRSWASRWAWVRSVAGAPDEQGGGSTQGRSSPSLVQMKQRTRGNGGKAAAEGGV